MYVSIDIGGTKTKVNLATTDLKIIDSVKLQTPRNSAEGIDLISSNISMLAKAQSLKGIGVASPGPIDTDKGLIISPRNLGWHNVDIVSALQNKFNCPVRLYHDATAGGVAEANIGNASGHSLVVYMTISTGIGTSIILNGQPIPSKHNSEGGRQIVKYGRDHYETFESIASGKAIQSRLGYIAADIKNQAEWADIAKDLSVGIYNISTIVQPDVIILGGGVSVHYEKFKSCLQNELNKFDSLYKLPEILQAKYVEEAPSLGALIMLKREMGNL